MTKSDEQVGARASHPLPARRDAEWDRRLNPRYTFASFVVGANNNLAQAAASAVAQSPAKAYNPLFIHGGVGLGKTHLIQAIGHAVTGNHRPARACYLSCEQFTNDFLQAMQTGALVRFRRKYRQVELLLIDDIQFLAGKERLQEEFFHTFNALFDAHKQIVLSSDRAAAEIANLEQRLASRFEWGLVTELQPPDLATRLAILKQKAALLQVELPLPVLEFIAARIRTNIRRLEGALVRVASYASLTGQPITLEAAEAVLRDALHQEGRRAVTIETIQRKVAENFDVRLTDMTSRHRPKNVVFPRQIAMYLSRKLTHRSLTDIGESFGGRDHGTVIHACQVIETQMATDPQLRQALASLQEFLQR